MSKQQFEQVSEPWKVFNRLFDGVVIINNERKMIYANEAFKLLCDVPRGAVAKGEKADVFIELPNECWLPESLSHAGGDFDGVGAREVGFITRSGTIGRAHVSTSTVLSGEEELTCLVIRDVSAEARVHAKYKVQAEKIEVLEKRSVSVFSEIVLLNKIISEVPHNADRDVALLHAVEQFKSDRAFQEVYCLQINDHGLWEPVGIDKRLDDQQQLLIRNLSKSLYALSPSEPVRQVRLESGIYWIAHVSSQFYSPAVFVVRLEAAREGMNMQVFFEILTACFSAQIDRSAVFFGAMVETISATYNVRYLRARIALQCQFALEKGVPFSAISFEFSGGKDQGTVEGISDGLAVAVAQNIRRRLRAGDILARTSDRRFMAVLSDTTTDAAKIIAESLMERFNYLAKSPASGVLSGVVCRYAIGSFDQESPKWYARGGQALIGAIEAELDKGLARAVADLNSTPIRSSGS